MTTTAISEFDLWNSLRAERIRADNAESRLAAMARAIKEHDWECETCIYTGRKVTEPPCDRCVNQSLYVFDMKKYTKK